MQRLGSKLRSENPGLSLTIGTMHRPPHMLLLPSHFKLMTCDFNGSPFLWRVDLSSAPSWRLAVPGNSMFPFKFETWTPDTSHFQGPWKKYQCYWTPLSPQNLIFPKGWILPLISFTSQKSKQRLLGGKCLLKDYSQRCADTCFSIWSYKKPAPKLSHQQTWAPNPSCAQPGSGWGSQNLLSLCHMPSSRLHTLHIGCLTELLTTFWGYDQPTIQIRKLRFLGYVTHQSFSEPTAMPGLRPMSVCLKAQARSTCLRGLRPSCQPGPNHPVITYCMCFPLWQNPWVELQIHRAGEGRGLSSAFWWIYEPGKSRRKKIQA